MPDFLRSSHKKNWIFSKEKLDSIYEDKQNSLVQGLVNMNVPTELLNFLLTKEEEETLILGLTKNLLVCSKHINMPAKAQSTAIAYFRRFFLRNPVCLNDPAILMFTALYVACKTEEINMRNVNAFCDYFPGIAGSNPQKILQNEMGLMSGIKFQLYVYSPFKPLISLIEYLKNKGIPDNELNEIAQRSHKFVEYSLFTDSFFLYTPSVLAIAGFYSGLSDRMDKDDLLEEIASMGANPQTIISSISEITKDVENIKEKLQNIDNVFKGLLKKAGTIKHRLGKSMSKTKKSNENPK